MMLSSLRRALKAAAVITVAAALPASGGASPHHKPLLFVSNLDGSVRIYSADIHKSDVKLKRSITTDTTRPEGVWIDAKGTLYVENGPQYPTSATIEEYKNGATSPFFTITEGLNSPGAVAVGSDGTVYVNQVGNAKGGGVIGVVAVYASGENKLERTINLNPTPEYGMTAGGVAFDRNGDLLAATFGNAAEVHVFKIRSGSSKAIDLGLQGYGGPAIAVDGHGNLYSGGDSFIAVYPSGATSPSRTIPTSFSVYGMTATRNGTLYAVAESFVAEYAPGASTPTNYVDTLDGETFTYDAALGNQE